MFFAKFNAEANLYIQLCRISDEIFNRHLRGSNLQYFQYRKSKLLLVIGSIAGSCYVF